MMSSGHMLLGSALSTADASFLRLRVGHRVCKKRKPLDPGNAILIKVVSFLRLFLGEIASGVSGKVGFGVSVKGDP